MLYLLLGLCLCILICSLLLGWTHFRRKGEVVSCQPGPRPCHKREDSSKGTCQLLEGRGTLWQSPRAEQGTAEA